MANESLSMSCLREIFSICRLDSTASIPYWVYLSDIYFIGRTPDELSIVCPSKFVPSSVKASTRWRAIRIQGPMSLEICGVLAAVVSPLKDASIPVFTVSTFDTDYVFVQDNVLRKACGVLKENGHHVDH